jgi:DNA polymerase III epsilon subunit-like protein
MNQTPTYCLFDFETSGIGAFKKQEALQLAWVICDKFMNVLHKYSFYFQEINEINQEFHKDVVLKDVKKYGAPRKIILEYFLNDIHKIIESNGKIIAHNIDFDWHILQNECQKEKISIPKTAYPLLYCTMKRSVDMCRIPKTHASGNKYPKLCELYKYLFGEDPEVVLHEAGNDVEVMRRCVPYVLGFNLK